MMRGGCRLSVGEVVGQDHEEASSLSYQPPIEAGNAFSKQIGVPEVWGLGEDSV